MGRRSFPLHRHHDIFSIRPGESDRVKAAEALEAIPGFIGHRRLRVVAMEIRWSIPQPGTRSDHREAPLAARCRCPFAERATGIQVHQGRSVNQQLTRPGPLQRQISVRNHGGHAGRAAVSQPPDTYLSPTLSRPARRRPKTGELGASPACSVRRGARHPVADEITLRFVGNGPRFGTRRAGFWRCSIARWDRTNHALPCSGMRLRRNPR